MAENLSEKIWSPSPKEIQMKKEWVMRQIELINPTTLLELGKSASIIRARAYQPYSNYSVGVSLLTLDGQVYSSVNAETVTYTETDHAERGTITKAISEGAIERNGRKFIAALAVSHEGDSGPCAGCRQADSRTC